MRFWSASCLCPFDFGFLLVVALCQLVCRCSVEYRPLTVCDDFPFTNFVSYPSGKHMILSWMKALTLVPAVIDRDKSVNSGHCLGSEKHFKAILVLS